MAGFLLDISPLRDNRNFRNLWSGQVINQFGTQLTVIALMFQVDDITRSKLAVGLLSAAQLVPLVASSIVGGTIADTYDRRKIMLICQFFMALTSVGLAVNAGFDHPPVWPLFVFAALQAAFLGVDGPTRSATTTALVGVDRLEPALALNILVFNFAHVAGPALAGIVIARWGPGPAYWLDAGSFAFAFLMTARLPALRPAGGGVGVSRKAIAEGFRFLGRHRLLQATFVADINAMVFGMPRALFPAMSREIFGGGATTLGLLNAAPALGALAGGIGAGWIGRIERSGRAVIIAILVWGGSIAVFGLSPWLWLALLCLAIAGAADMVSAVFRSAISQSTASDDMRGRMSAIFTSVVRGGPLVGDFEAGAVAQATSLRTSAVSGGVICMGLMGIIARAYPELDRYRKGRAPARIDPDLPSSDPDPDLAPEGTSP